MPPSCFSQDSRALVADAAGAGRLEAPRAAQKHLSALLAALRGLICPPRGIQDNREEFEATRCLKMDVFAGFSSVKGFNDGLFLPLPPSKGEHVNPGRPG